MDQEKPPPIVQGENSQEVEGPCRENVMLPNNGTRKRIRKRKPKNGIAKNDEVSVPSCSTSVEANQLEVEHCTTELNSSDSLRHMTSVLSEIKRACSHKSPKKRELKEVEQVTKANRKPKKTLVKNVNNCSGISSPRDSNKGTPQSPAVSSLGNGLHREKRGMSNGLDVNSPLKHNFSPSENVKTFSPRNRKPSQVDEDSFEDYLPVNVVEGLLQLDNYLQGVIRINQKSYTEAYISEPAGGRDILIEDIRNRNRALEGDEVVVAILPESQWKILSPTVKQKTGKVIYILRAVHSRQAIGVLKPMAMKNSLQALFSPRDSRIPRMRVPITECPPNFEKNPDALYLARITTWDNVRFARGTLMGNSIGLQGDIDVETAAILLEYQIRMTPYPSDLVPHFPEHLSQEDFKNRQDLRKECIFSIDPLTARDLDDAVSCEVLENGNYLIGVHISDVSHYLQENTQLDHLVAETATTTYLVQSVYHMLPREMTMKCSLLPGQDKLAFSVFWELKETENEVNVISHRFTRSVINSCAQLAYEHAQVMLENPDKEWQEGELPRIFNGFTPQKLSLVVCALNRLAIKLRNRRFESGSLRIDQAKLNFCLDKEGLPTGMSVYENKESHRLIEEFMLLANITVATTLHEAFPQIAFLRQHSPPLPFLMDKLRDQLELSGIVIDTQSSGALQESLAAYRDVLTPEGVARSLALNSLFAKPMARARYFCLSKATSDDEVCHYALNVPIYTHFTSPIRRYADIMVHRLLSAFLNYSPPPHWTEDFVSSVASNCNMRKYNAKKAGEQSSELFLAVFLKERGPLRGQAVVVDVKDRSFDAIFAQTGTVVRIYSDKIGAQAETLDKGQMLNIALTWFPRAEDKPVRQVISLFSIVNVEIKCSTTNVLKIEPTLLPPWEEMAPVNPLQVPDTTVNGVSPDPATIDLSSFKLPDILDDVRECLYTSDDDLSSPESVCESQSSLVDEEFKNVTVVSGGRRL